MSYGIALVAIVGHVLLMVKQHDVEASHVMSHGFFGVLASGAVVGASGFSSQRALKEIHRVQRGAGSCRMARTGLPGLPALSKSAASGERSERSANQTRDLAAP
jgi:hypothetical protein